MDVKLENLIEKIKEEAVEEARKSADELLKKTEQEAKSMINDAEKEAKHIIEDAKQKGAKFQENAELAIQQAARDSELLLKEKFTAMCDNVFKKEVSGVLEPDFLKKLILKIIDQWAGDPQMEISVNKEDTEKLEKLLKESLKGELKKSITIRPSSDIADGFRIGLKGGDVYYDFSGESISELLKMFLNPRIKKILENKNG